MALAFQSTTELFKNDFKTSNFRSLLRLFPKDKITEQQIISGLNYKQKETWKQIPKYLTMCEKAVYFWTTDNYKTIQTLLVNDSYKELKNYMPLIRAITMYVSNNATNTAMTVYRKVDLINRKLNDWKNAKIG